MVVMMDILKVGQMANKSVVMKVQTLEIHRVVGLEY